MSHDTPGSLLRRLPLRARGWRPWPQGLTGQLIAVLVIGALAAHAVVLAWLLGSSQRLHPLSRAQALERLGAAYRMAEVARPERINVLLAAVNSPDAQFGVQPAPDVESVALDSTERLLVEDLRARLDNPPGLSLRLRLEPGHHVNPGSPAPAVEAAQISAPWHLHVSVALSDGRWLNASLAPIAAVSWWDTLPFTIAASVLPLLLVVVLHVRRILRPMRALAQAAERASRGERIATLPIEGPRETREVAEAFNTLQQRLVAFVDDRTRMLAAISHDFRTPITSLRLRAEMVDDPALRSAMIRTLREMEAMMDETLQFTHDDARAEPTQAVDLRAMLWEVADEHRLLGRQVDVMDQAGPATPAAALAYRCRPVALKRAIGNLADNAVRYGSQARLRLLAPDAATLCIEVDDDGPGIPEADLTRVFDPFIRLDASRPVTGGVGLGLSIARSCVHAHGGELMLVNRPGGGLTARIRLPA